MLYSTFLCADDGRSMVCLFADEDKATAASVAVSVDIGIIAAAAAAAMARLNRI